MANGPESFKPVKLEYREESHVPQVMPIGGVPSFATGTCTVFVHTCEGCDAQEIVFGLSSSIGVGGLHIPLSRYRAIQLAQAMLDLANSLPGPQHDKP